MKCHLMQKPKHRMSKETEKKLQGVINNYVSLSLAVGAEKALKIMRDNREKKNGVESEAE